jgi:hypothetical protein
MQPIVISDVTVSLAEFERLNKQLTGRRRLWVLILLPLTFSYFFWSSVTADGSTALTPSTLLLFAMMLIILVGMVLQGIRRAVRRSYEAGRAYLAPTTYILSEEGLSVFSAAVNSQVQWGAFRRATALDGWWHLQTTAGGYFVDARQVQPPATAADVTDLLRRRGLLT